MMRNQSGSNKTHSKRWGKVISSFFLLTEAAIASTVLSIFVATNPNVFNVAPWVYRSPQIKHAPPAYILSRLTSPSRPSNKLNEPVD